ARWLNTDIHPPIDTTEVNFTAPAKKTRLATGEKEGNTHEEDVRQSNDQVLNSIVQAIPKVLEREPQHPEAFELVLVALASLVRNALLSRGTGMSRFAAASSLAWLNTYSRFAYTTEGRDELAAPICAVACLSA